MKTYHPLIIELFKDYGLDVGSIITAPKNAKDTTKLTYSCVCGNDISNAWRTVMSKPLCGDCMPRKKNGPKKNIDNVVNILAAKGYVMVDESKYVNEKTKIYIKKIGQTDEDAKYMTLANFKQTDGKTKAESNDDKKLSIIEVKKRVKNAGFEWIDGTNYVNKTTHIEVLCHCKRKFEVTIGNLNEDRVGCQQCYHYNRKYNWEYIEGIADKTGCTLITPREDYHGRDTIIEIICACDELMIKNVRGFLASPRCSQCSNFNREETNLEKYGAKNYFASEYGKDVIRSYYINNYGVSHNMQIKEIQQKAQETCLKNYGVKCVLSTKDVRDKAVKAHVNKWGDRPGCVIEIQNKMKATNMINLNVEYPLQSKKVQATIKCNNKEKYGHEVFIQSPTGKKLMVEKYGVEYALQNAELFMKQRKSSLKRKQYEFPSGKLVEIQGYEWMCLNDLIDANINEDDIIVKATKMPKIMYQLEIDGIIKTKRYFADIWVKSLDTVIEIKSSWTYSKETEQNRAKWLAASFICTGGIIIFVYDKDGDYILTFHVLNGKIIEEERNNKKKQLDINVMGEFQ